jgi:hypothetical protein
MNVPQARQTQLPETAAHRVPHDQGANQHGAADRRAKEHPHVRARPMRQTPTDDRPCGHELKYGQQFAVKIAAKFNDLPKRSNLQRA